MRALFVPRGLQPTPSYARSVGIHRDVLHDLQEHSFGLGGSPLSWPDSDVFYLTAQVSFFREEVEDFVQFLCSLPLTVLIAGQVRRGALQPQSPQRLQACA